MQLTESRKFFTDIMKELESETTSTDKKSIYLFVNCHANSVVHDTFRFCTNIFPTQERAPTATEEGSAIVPARPIFFNYE